MPQEPVKPCLKHLDIVDESEKEISSKEREVTIEMQEVTYNVEVTSEIKLNGAKIKSDQKIEETPI